MTPPPAIIEGTRVSTSGKSGNITVASDQKSDDPVQNAKAIERLVEKFDMKIHFADVSANTLKLTVDIKVFFFRLNLFSDLYKKDGDVYTLASKDFSNDFESVATFLKSSTVKNARTFTTHYFHLRTLDLSIT